MHLTMEQVRDHLKALAQDRGEQMAFARKHNMLELFEKAELDWHSFQETILLIDQKLKEKLPVGKGGT